METFVTFTVEDTSPCVSYSPLPYILSAPNLTAGWNPYFNVSGFNTAPGGVGVGTSQHITALDGASFALQWRGAGITLMGNVTNDASYNVTVDGVPTMPSPSSNVLADIQGLNDTTHSIVITAMIPPPTGTNPPNSSILVFDSAIIFSSSVPTSANLSLTRSTIVDSDILFSGLWSIDPLQNSSGDPQFHTSMTVGDKAFAEFNGTTLLILGRTSPAAGNYTVTIDAGDATSMITETHSALSVFSQDAALLFFASELDPTVSHTVAVVNQGGELALAVNGFEAFTETLFGLVVGPQPANSTSIITDTSRNAAIPARAIAGGVVGGVVLLAVIAFLLLRACRPSVDEAEPFPPYDEKKADPVLERSQVSPIDPERPRPFVLSEKQQAPEMKPTDSVQPPSSLPNFLTVSVPPGPSDVARGSTAPLTSSANFPTPNIVTEAPTHSSETSAQIQPQDTNLVDELQLLRRQVQILQNRVQSSSEWSDSLPPSYTTNSISRS